MNYEKLQEYAFEKMNFTDGDVLASDCDTLVFLLDNCEITIDSDRVFFGTVNTDKISEHVFLERADKYLAEFEKIGVKDGYDALAYTGRHDFSHTTAQWKDILSLGLVGIKNRLAEYNERENNQKKKRFYSNLLKVWEACLRFVRRAAEKAAENGKALMSESLFNISEKAPETLFEAMQTIVVYYVLQMFFDGTYLRTLGRLDWLLYPFYVKEPESDRRRLLIEFLKDIDKLQAPSNIPFAIGGTDEKGNSLINELSFDIIDAYATANTNNTKFHILYSDNMPQGIIKRAFEEIRKGNNSIVFMNDRVIIESLLKMGEDKSDATDYHVVGCYECGGNGELTCSCNGRVNIPKALEVALNGGRDMLTGKLIGLANDGFFPTFESLYLEFKRQLTYFSDCAIKCTDVFEKEYKNIHSAPILSATYISALEKGGDLYCDYAAKYNNSSIDAIGLGTAVDSLWAIKKAVYDDKVISLKYLVDVLRSNWKDNEILRLTFKNKYEKWGNGVDVVDELGKRIVDDLSAVISGRKNMKGGIYRLGTFSINWRWEFGEKTAASADGRKAGETLSQNTSATFGADKSGATEHLLSVAKIDATKTPNASIVDIDLHSSSVSGENGITALMSSLKGYFDMGGFAVHYNVLDTETLKKAYLDPDAYPNLQVRLCGWNVLFSSLTKKEQEEFIARSER